MVLKHQDGYKNDIPSSKIVLNSPIQNNPTKYIKVPHMKTYSAYLHFCTGLILDLLQKHSRAFYSLKRVDICKAVQIIASLISISLHSSQNEIFIVQKSKLHTLKKTKQSQKLKQIRGQSLKSRNPKVTLSMY